MILYREVCEFMIKNIIKKIGAICMAGVVMASNASAVKIVLDPGHGGTSPGCVRDYDGRKILEKDLNYEIASKIKSELENYETKDESKLEVYLTHENSSTYNPLLEARVSFGSQIGANAVISLHINVSEDVCRNGAMVLVTDSNFNELYDAENELAKCFLDELRGLGIGTPPDVSDILLDSSKISINNGVMRRLSDDGSVYENGDTTDWYGIVRFGVEKKIPAIIVEHAYLSNEGDYREFLSSDEKLDKLAEADVRAIANYYNLVKKSDCPSELKLYEEVSVDDKVIEIENIHSAEV